MNMIEKLARAMELARCPNREGPYGGYDYGYPDGKPFEGGRYVVRDFRDPHSADWGKWVHQTDDGSVHERVFKEMTEAHIVRAILTALSEPSEEMLNAAVDATDAGSGMSWVNRSPQKLFEQGFKAMIQSAQEG